jgi:hypothetical protein
MSFGDYLLLLIVEVLCSRGLCYVRGEVFTISTYPKSLGGLYDPGPGISLFEWFKADSYLAAVPNLLTPAFLNFDNV